MVTKYASRELAATTLIDFLNGKINSEVFQERFPLSLQDPVLQAVADLVWYGFPDFYTHKLSDKSEAPLEVEQLLKRAHVFLHSDLAYEWPRYRFASLRNLVLRLLGLYSLVRGEFEEFKAPGEWDVWPFFRRVDYERFAIRDEAELPAPSSGHN